MTELKFFTPDPNHSDVLEQYKERAVDVYETARASLRENDLVVVIFDCHEEQGVVADRRLNLLAQPTCPPEIRESIQNHPAQGLKVNTSLGFWLCVVRDDFSYIFTVVGALTSGAN
jgi:hypothetical protein